MSPPRLDQPFVEGRVQTVQGPVPRVSARLKWPDHWGSIKARWGVGRMQYTVDPGLYALGSPSETSALLVTSNYKMSFDHLRRSLSGRSVWILVLDTQGINVWCAAGKGTFGTEELVHRVGSAGIAKSVSHRELILPQLSAPGVSAHAVKKKSGFKVIYGPIEAQDLPAFIDSGFKATPEMRRKHFNIRERAALIPVELVGAAKWTLIVLPVFFLLGGLGGPQGFWPNALNYGLFAAAALLGALAAGAVFTPLLLPWLPGRAFSFKGMVAGLLTALIFALFRTESLSSLSGRFELSGFFLLVPAISAYLGMNFTGASTYTSLSGVKKEMRLAVPLEIAGAVIGFGLWLGSRWLT